MTSLAENAVKPPTADAIRPAAPDAILARRRPVAIAIMFLAELAWALLVATPFHAWARRAWGGLPDGDAALFAPGGRDLLMWLGHHEVALTVAARSSIVLLAVGAVLMQLPFGAMVASLAFARDEDRGPSSLRTTTAWRLGLGAFLPLAALLALAATLAGVLLGLGGAAASSLDGLLTNSIGDARAFFVQVAIVGLFAGAAALAGVFVDLARAAVVRQAGLAAANGTTEPGWTMTARALRAAFVTARGGLGRATLAWASRAVAGLALLAIGYAASDALGGRGGLPLVGLFVIHQGVVAGRVALRASWMARALRLVAAAQGARS